MPPARPSPLQLFLIFSRIGLTSFGGGLSGWFLREFVQERHWLTEEEFLNGLGLAQALPGVNVTNMAIWIGYRMRGLPGALAGFCGIVFPAALVIVAIGVAFATLVHDPIARLALTGAAAAAIGLSLSMGLVAARRVPRRAMPLAIMVASFVAVGPLHLPLVRVALVAVVISVGEAWFRLRQAAR
jgi:chromate transporter